MRGCCLVERSRSSIFPLFSLRNPLQTGIVTISCRPPWSARDSFLLRLTTTMRIPRFLSGAIVLLLLPAFASADGLTLTPPQATLHGKSARQQLLATATAAGKAV